jgi:hypothetical protein
MYNYRHYSEAIMYNNLDLYRVLYPRVSVDSLHSAVAFHTGLMDCYVACMDSAHAAYHNEARLLADAELRKRGE